MPKVISPSVVAFVGTHFELTRLFETLNFHQLSTKLSTIRIQAILNIHIIVSAFLQDIPILLASNISCLR